MLVSNENYEVIAGLFDNDKHECYGVVHKVYRVVEIHTRSLTYANIYAVCANRTVMSRVWNDTGSAEEMADLGGMVPFSKRAN